MPRAEPPDASDYLYSERLIRSVAHNIGNAVNVLSGRLSLLEMEDGLRPESMEMVALMKDRLRRTQAELRGAVRFVSETIHDANVAAPGPLEQVLTELDNCEEFLGPIAGKVQAKANEAALACHAASGLKFALRVLSSGVRALASDDEWPAWSLQAKPEGLALEVAVPGAALPTDRRLLLEPWFEPAAMNLPLRERRGRMEAAVALGKLEDGGANVSVSLTGGEARLQVLWNYT
jgi:hypothetical protein